MIGATRSTYGRSGDHSQHVTLKIWSKTGSIFEDLFSIDQTTFADVKHSAIQHLLTKNNNSNLSNYRHLTDTNRFSSNNIPLDEVDDYKLISMESKRAVDEQKTLSQERVKDGDEYLLTTKLSKQSSVAEQLSESSSIDEKLIESRTQDLPEPSHLSNRDYRLTGRTEFRTDLNRILITLIEISQKLLWCRPDAEMIFKQAEEILLKSSTDESTASTKISTNPNDVEKHQLQIRKLVDMGFTEQQAEIALKRTRYNLHSAMELLLTQSDINDEEEEKEEEETKTFNVTTPLFSRNGPFISFRQFRQERFQPNSIAINALKEMGFNHDDIVAALRIFNNDKNLACEYLLGDRQQQQKVIDADNEQGLDPNSSMVQAIMQNAIVQRTLNNPKTFFVMLQISENPSSITNYLNDPEIGNMFLQVSRIYHAEKDQMNTPTNNRRNSNHQRRHLSRTIDDDSD